MHKSLKGEPFNAFTRRQAVISGLVVWIVFFAVAFA